MRSILEELFYGNISPNTDCRSRDKETKQLMGYIADHHDNLLSTLNEQQKEILEKFDDCYNELIDINEREIFAYAFKLGAKLMLTVMEDIVR
ncbi:MAG: hypothetical protein E7589_07525 [Ruminococcaceae bacterium]|nr:hypothetical protein [Oscillospiraceae bacterium]